MSRDQDGRQSARIFAVTAAILWGRLRERDERQSLPRIRPNRIDRTPDHVERDPLVRGNKLHASPI